MSVDPPNVSGKLAKKQGYGFPILSDQGAAIARRYDLLHEKAGVDAADIARPAEFLIDPSGAVRWRNLTEDYKVRVRADEILEELDALGVLPAPVKH